MKVIELLQRMANKEEMPKRIKVSCYVFEYDEEINAYFDIDNSSKYSLVQNWLNNAEKLNSKVEIIEEDKTIKELQFDSDEKYITTITGTTNKMRNIDVTLATKINELVKEIKKIKEN